MNLLPPPITDDVKMLKDWCDDLYEFLKYPTFMGKIDVQGLFVNITSKTGTYTILETDDVLLCNGTFTVTLPAVGGTPTGKLYHIVNTGSGVVTVSGDGSENIDGSNTQAISIQYECLAVTHNGTEWFTI